MPRLTHSLPKYRKHRASGQAIVNIAGKDHYLGPHGTRASKMLYDRLVAEYLALGRQISPSNQEERRLTVVQVLAQYWRFCKGYYVKDGAPTNEQDAMKIIIRDIRQLYGTTAAEEFGPKALKAVRQRWIERGQARPTINKNMRRLTRIFKWAVSEELLPADVYRALTTVPGLKKGRTDVPEPPPIMPVDVVIVQQTMARLPSIIADMVRLQLLTGMRPGEVCTLCPRDIDRTSEIWEYRPRGHKTEHHGRSRTVYVGPEAQAVLKGYLERELMQYCFSPQENMRQFLNRKSECRKTPLSCGNRPGTNRKPKPRKNAGTRYTPNSYRQAVHRACDVVFSAPAPLAKLAVETKLQHQDRLTDEQRAELEAWQISHRWSPNQLRHTAGTAIRKRFGLEAAQVILGHAAADITQVYAERDADKAREVARQIG